MGVLSFLKIILKLQFLILYGLNHKWEKGRFRISEDCSHEQRREYVVYIIEIICAFFLINKIREFF